MPAAPASPTIRQERRKWRAPWSALGGQGGERSFLRALALALPLLVCHAGLLLVFDLGRHLVSTLTLLGAAFLWLPFAVRRLAAASLPGKAILWGALLLRLALLPLPATLSDNVLRYLWDGKVAAAGFNPYALPPGAPELVPLRDESWQVPHAEIPTVYPPLAIGAFSIATRFPFPLLAWKGIVTAADLLACGLLLALARRTGIAEARAAWYAWNPLAALEAAGMGHVDALGVAAAVAAVLLVTRVPSSPSGLPRRILPAAVCAAAALLVQPMAGLAVPLWSRASGRPWRFLAAAAGLAAVALLPVLLTAGAPPGLAGFAGGGASREQTGPAYELLSRLLSSAGAVELALAAGILCAFVLSFRERDPVAGTGRLFGRILLLSAAVHPWQLLWVLPWAALGRSGWDRAWLALSGLILLTYLPQFTGVPWRPWVFLAVWGPFALLLAAGAGREARV